MHHDAAFNPPSAFAPDLATRRRGRRGPALDGGHDAEAAARADGHGAQTIRGHVQSLWHHPGELALDRDQSIRGHAHRRPIPAISTNFTLSPILAPLQPYQSDIVVLRGVNMETTQPQYGPVANVHDQGMTHQLTAIGLVKGPAGAGRANHFLDGSAGGPSIDQHMAQSIGKTTLLPSLQLGVETSSTFLEPMVTRMCYGNVVPTVVNGTMYPLASVFPRSMTRWPSTRACSVPPPWARPIRSRAP